MTVRELIEYLDKLPKDTQVAVLYKAYSDVVILEEDDLTFRDKQYLDANDHLASRYPERRYVLRHGKIMEYQEHQWPPDEKPVFVPVLILPGN